MECSEHEGLHKHEGQAAFVGLSLSNSDIIMWWLQTLKKAHSLKKKKDFPKLLYEFLQSRSLIRYFA